MVFEVFLKTQIPSLIRSQNQQNYSLSRVKKSNNFLIPAQIHEDQFRPPIITVPQSNIEQLDAEPNSIEDNFANIQQVNESFEQQQWPENPTASTHENKLTNNAQIINFQNPINPDQHSLQQLITPQGIIMSLIVLALIRVSRESGTRASWDSQFALENSLDYEAKQLERLIKLQKLKEIQKSEGEQSDEEVEKSIKEATKIAKKKEEEKQKRDVALKEAARKEQLKLQQLKQAEQKAYEEAEQRMQEELQRRTEIERKIRAEAEQKRREEEERLARIKTEQEEAERKAREEEERKLREEKEALKRMMQTFAINIDFQHDLQSSQESIQLTIKSGTSSGGQSEPIQLEFEDIQAMQDQGIRSTVMQSISQTCDMYRDFCALRKLSQEGPLEWMDEVELQYWMSKAKLRTCETISQGIDYELNQEDRRLPMKGKGRVRTEHSVLPIGRIERLDEQSRIVIELLKEEKMPLVRTKMVQLLEGCEEEISKNLKIELPSYVGSCLMMAHLLNRMYDEWPPKQIEAPAWYQLGVKTVSEELAEICRDAPKDSLSDVYEVIKNVLGESDPVSKITQDLAERNMSAYKRSQIEQQRRLEEAKRAAKILEEEWPDYQTIREQSYLEKEKLTPVPERVWALCNVGRQLSRGGAGEVGRARRFLEQAVRLQQQYLQDEEHPGMLEVYEALCYLLEYVPEWQNEAKGVRARMFRILVKIAERYRDQQDFLSAVILMEDILQDYELYLGQYYPAFNKVVQQMNNLRGALNDDDRQKVLDARGRPQPRCANLGLRFFEKPLIQQQTQQNLDLAKWNYNQKLTSWP